MMKYEISGNVKPCVLCHVQELLFTSDLVLYKDVFQVV